VKQARCLHGPVISFGIACLSETNLSTSLHGGSERGAWWPWLVLLPPGMHGPNSPLCVVRKSISNQRIRARMLWSKAPARWIAEAEPGPPHARWSANGTGPLRGGADEGPPRSSHRRLDLHAHRAAGADNAQNARTSRGSYVRPTSAIPSHHAVPRLVDGVTRDTSIQTS